MPRYYCDYCDAYLTHDSAMVRKQHNIGFKHKANVKAYYLQYEEEAQMRLWAELNGYDMPPPMMMGGRGMPLPNHGPPPQGGMFGPPGGAVGHPPVGGGPARPPPPMGQTGSLPPRGGGQRHGNAGMHPAR